MSGSLSVQKIDSVAYSTVDTSKAAEIINIDLARDTMLYMPPKGYLINVNNFGIAKFTPDKPFLITDSLYSCKAVIFYDGAEKKGLLCHLPPPEKIAWAEKIDRLVSEFNPSTDLKNVKVYVIEGRYQSDSSPFTIDSIVYDISKYHPFCIYVDRHFTSAPMPKGILLNLQNGKVSQLKFGDPLIFPEKRTDLDTTIDKTWKIPNFH